MAIKKSELYSSLWQSCDALRGGMDASQYKDYVLVLLFVKYVSDKYGTTNEGTILVPDGATFADMVELKGKSTIGDDINKKIIGPIFKANELISAPDFNDATKLGDGKEMVDRLTNLISIFEDASLDFSQNRADGDDILGDAYEYLMRHFATESGKSKGQFYTPSEVSRVMANILGIQDAEISRSTTVYDPTCGSGSLLLKVASVAPENPTLYGQEKDSATAALARMNMILHNAPTAVIERGNTLANPLFLDNEKLKTFDYVVANPPFSDKRWSTGIDPENDTYERFTHFGTPPAKQGDYAYLLHIVRSLRSDGTGACILPHGVLFRGNAEATIRENLVRRGLIKGIIGLPANLFYGTGIPACIIVIDKRGARNREDIFIIDGSKGFLKDGNKNRLREMDIHRIVDVFNRQAKDDARYARRVPIAEIESNDFNLNIPRYIDSQEAEDIQDIDGHLRGGIPEADIDAIKRFWKVCPGLREPLFSERRAGYVDLAVDKSDINDVIFEHPEFVTFSDTMEELFASWRDDTVTHLASLEKGDVKPKELVAELGDKLLAHYEGKPLIDHYAVYQHFMDYWYETMQDDVYLIAADGWSAETRRVTEVVKSGKKKGQTKDVGWTCDLVPKELIVARYFASEAAAIAELEVQLEAASAEQTELDEENGSDDGALAIVSTKGDAKDARQEAVETLWAQSNPKAYKDYQAAVSSLETLEAKLAELTQGPSLAALENSRGNVTLKSIRNRLSELGSDEDGISGEDTDEHSHLSQYLEVYDDKKLADKRVKKLLKQATRMVEQRLAASDGDDEDLADIRVLDRYLELYDTISATKKAVKVAEAELDELAYTHYPTLSEDDVKSLVIGAKWLTTLSARINGELDRISQSLTQRVKELADRYETSLPVAMEQVDALQAKVDAHLEQMGFAWN